MNNSAESGEIIKNGVSTSIGSIFSGLTSFIPPINPIYFVAITIIAILLFLFYYYYNFHR